MILRTIIIKLYRNIEYPFNMIVCICKNVNTAQILASVEAGARSVEDVRDQTGASSCCGKCQFAVNRIVNDELSADSAPLFYNATATV